MPRPKSLLKSFDFDNAKKAHNCQHNGKHRINAGDKRLKLKVNRTHEHYCLECAKKIIESDLLKLKSALEQINE
ncbi:MAG: hypothetical protein JXK07_09920 [Spirochaetes bacterium]|nr:hypothetical protein [Spirochaetota bacterium]MBN2771286.1 hypothetical protein [Spirochaetota bacterium]